MAQSNGRNLANLLGDNEKLTKEKISSDVPLGTEDYSEVNDLSTTNNQVGDQAYVAETNSLYIWTGTSWYNIALINQTPTWDSGGQPDAEYELDSIGGIATSITLSATDPDGLPIQWGYSITDSGNDLATVSNDSNGTFTIIAKSLEDILSAGYDSSGGIFSITFRASDGANLATALSEFTIAFFIPFTAQGTVSGYVSGGSSNPGVGASGSTLDRFSFASDGNAALIGSTWSSISYPAVGMSAPEWGAILYSNAYIQFHFPSESFGVFSASGLTNKVQAAGHSSEYYGYATGGNPVNSDIEKVGFVNNTGRYDIGDLTVARRLLNGVSSTNNGYSTSGYGTNVIDQFSYSSDGNATNVGDTGVNQHYAAGNQSDTYGYTSAGNPGFQSLVTKFPFASVGTAVNVLSLPTGREGCSGQSSTTHGYVSGGQNGSGTTSVVEKFPFASDANGVNVGNLTSGRHGSGGMQY